MNDIEKLPHLVALAAGYLAGAEFINNGEGIRKLQEDAVRVAFGVLRGIEERLEAGNG